MGKSNILLRFLANEFRLQHELTMGVQFNVKTIELNNQSIKIQIWDTAGEETFKSITRTYYKGADGALLVYDITRKETFLHLKSWLDDVKETASKEICVILIGNKQDLESQYEM